MKLIITTCTGTKEYTEIESFLTRDETNPNLITAYRLTLDNGNQAGNTGLNAGAYLYTILEEIEEEREAAEKAEMEAQFKIYKNYPGINNTSQEERKQQQKLK